MAEENNKLGSGSSRVISVDTITRNEIEFELETRRGNKSTNKKNVNLVLTEDNIGDLAEFLGARAAVRLITSALGHYFGIILHQYDDSDVEVFKKRFDDPNFGFSDRKAASKKTAEENAELKASIERAKDKMREKGLTEEEIADIYS